MNRDLLIDFYKKTEYKKDIRDELPLRPSEWNLPIHLNDIFKSNPDFFSDLSKKVFDHKIEIKIDESNIHQLRGTLLHESLFSFYKAFYNYLAARRLYKGGIEHWIEITIYYSKLYLARSINTLLGKQLYSIGHTKEHFIPEVLRAINPKGYDKYINGGHRISYSVELDINIENRDGRIIFSKQSISTHQDIWKAYKRLSVEDLGLIRLDNFNTDSWDLIDERNRENYSFDGYRQLDFNLFPASFPGYFNRDEIIETSSIIYDEFSGEVLTNFQQLFHLYNDFEIFDLPIELFKFEHMINYMLDESIEKEKLLNLCKEGFPLENKYTNDLSIYYNS